VSYERGSPVCPDIRVRFGTYPFARLWDGHQGRYSSQIENNYITEMCSGSEAGSYLRLIDCVDHSTIGLRVTKKKFTKEEEAPDDDVVRHHVTPAHIR